MEIFLALAYEVAPLLIDGALSVLSHFLDDFVPLFNGEQVGHVAVVQNITNIFQLRLLPDLSVAEQEHTVLHFHSCDLQNSLQLFRPVLRVHLEQVVARHEAAQHRQRLTSTPSHAHQQSMAVCSRDYPYDPYHMLNSIHKQHQVHLLTHVEVIIFF